MSRAPVSPFARPCRASSSACCDVKCEMAVSTSDCSVNMSWPTMPKWSPVASIIKEEERDLIKDGRVKRIKHVERLRARSKGQGEELVKVKERNETESDIQ